MSEMINRWSKTYIKRSKVETDEEKISSNLFEGIKQSMREALNASAKEK